MKHSLFLFSFVMACFFGSAGFAGQRAAPETTFNFQKTIDEYIKDAPQNSISKYDLDYFGPALKQSYDWLVKWSPSRAKILEQSAKALITHPSRIPNQGLNSGVITDTIWYLKVVARGLVNERVAGEDSGYFRTNYIVSQFNKHNVSSSVMWQYTEMLDNYVQSIKPGKPFGAPVMKAAIGTYVDSRCYQKLTTRSASQERVNSIADGSCLADSWCNCYEPPQSGNSIMAQIHR